MTEGHCPACLLDRLVDLAPETGGVASAGLADYELEEVIGRGGMGIVWRARQRRLDRVVAIKFLAGGGWASDEARARIRAEALAVARLRHPGIVPVIDVGESENGPWLSMEFVAGQTLGERLKAGPLPPRIAAELLCAVTEAIAHAHQRGVLHRDLKPGNILLDAGGSPHVTDFGLARVAGEDSSLTRTGQMLGSPAYLAPEILSHAEPSEAGDVYALGATLYHVLTGQPPFDGPTVDGVLRQVAESQPVPPRRLVPAIPADLETIVLTCLLWSGLCDQGCLGKDRGIRGRVPLISSKIGRPVHSGRPSFLFSRLLFGETRCPRHHQIDKATSASNQDPGSGRR